MTDAGPGIAALKPTLIESVVQTFLAGRPVRPQVHVYDENYSGRSYPGQPYAGHITCKDYQDGPAAVQAIGQLGAIARAMGGTRILVAWEEGHLRTSVLGPAANHQNGVAILDVSDRGHQLNWHPFGTASDDQFERGSGAELIWGTAIVHSDARLLPGVTDLVQAWRAVMLTPSTQVGQVWAQHLLILAADAGYGIRPVLR